MDFIAKQNYLLTSPRKIRPVVTLIKKMLPMVALEKLPYVGRRSAEPLAKVIKSAIANAKNKGVAEKDLIFKSIQVNEGPRLKRGQPVSRGQWHRIIKRMSHIRVVLTTLKSETKGKEKNVTKI